MIYSRILGTGSYLPERILTNADLEKTLDTSDAWIVERTGIRSRHILADHESATTMAYDASIRALEAAGRSFSDIDLIIAATSTPENVFPGVSCLLQKRFDIGGCPAFDLNASACAGFVYGLGIADQFIRNGSVKTALVLGTEVMSRVMDWTDRTTCILFGDGAGAVVLGADSKPGVISTHLHADGRFADVLYLETSMARREGDAPKKPGLQMSGNSLFRQAVTILGDLFDETLSAGGVDRSAIDWLIPHQANVRIIQAMARKLQLPLERVVMTLETQGNTSSASIPLALDTAIRDGRIQRGETLLLEGFGGGLAWGSALIQY